MTNSSRDSAVIVWQLGFPPITREERDASQALSISAFLTEDQYRRDRDRGSETNNQ